MNGNVLCIGGPMDGQVMALPDARQELRVPFMERPLPLGRGIADLLREPPVIHYEIRLIAIPFGPFVSVPLRVALAPWLVDDMEEVTARIRRNMDVMKQLAEQADKRQRIRTLRHRISDTEDKLRRLRKEANDLREEVWNV